MSDDDPYQTVDCHVKLVREKSVLIETAENSVWVPRTVLHASSDLRLKDLEGEDAELKIRAWFCDKEGIE